jgi:hypothetical protein
MDSAMLAYFSRRGNIRANRFLRRQRIVFRPLCSVEQGAHKKRGPGWNQGRGECFGPLTRRARRVFQTPEGTRRLTSNG